MRRLLIASLALLTACSAPNPSSVQPPSPSGAAAPTPPASGAPAPSPLTPSGGLQSFVPTPMLHTLTPPSLGVARFDVENGSSRSAFVWLYDAGDMSPISLKSGQRGTVMIVYLDSEAIWLGAAGPTCRMPFLRQQLPTAGPLTIALEDATTDSGLSVHTTPTVAPSPLPLTGDLPCVSPTPTPTRAPTPTPQPGVTELRFDVVNRSHRKVEVFLTGDPGGFAMNGFLPGQRGTLTVASQDPRGAVQVSVIGYPGCTALVGVTPLAGAPLTVFLDDDPSGDGGIILQTEPTVAASPIPAPSNDFSCMSG